MSADEILTDHDFELLEAYCAAFGHVWEESDIWCELCGEHSGLFCTRCEDAVDLIYSDDPREDERRSVAPLLSAIVPQRGMVIRLPITLMNEAELEAFGQALGYHCVQEPNGNIIFVGRR